MMHVAFYRGHTRLRDRLISWWLGGPYSHCELVLETDETGTSLCASSALEDGGVRIKCMRLHAQEWDLVPVQGDHTALRAQAKAWLLDHEDDGYDMLGLLGFVWRPERGSRNRWTCSESVAAMLGFQQSWRFDPCAFHSVVSWYQPAEN